MIENQYRVHYKNEYKCGCITVRTFFAEGVGSPVIGFEKACNLHQEELSIALNNARWSVFDMLDHASGRIIE